jgi:hypothetical protein
MLSVGKKVGVCTSIKLKKAKIRIERTKSMNRMAMRALGLRYFWIPGVTACLRAVTLPSWVSARTRASVITLELWVPAITTRSLESIFSAGVWMVLTIVSRAPVGTDSEM